MKNIRLSISGLMALVLFMALDFGACKALMESPIGPSQLSDLLVCGALPMANVLVIGLIMLIKSPPDDGGRRSGLLGFEVFGLVAWGIFLAGSMVATRSFHKGFGGAFRAIGVEPGPLLALGVSALMMLPQVAFGLLGRRLFRTYEVRVTVLVGRRGTAEPRPGPSSERLNVAKGM